MNEILQLKGTFQQRPNESTPGPRNVPKNAPIVSTKNLRPLLNSLQNVSAFWAKNDLLEGCLIDVYYIDVIAKSNRITGFLSGGRGSVNDTIVGARFDMNQTKRKHIITHYVSKDILKHTIEKLQGCIELMEKEFGGNISYDLIEDLRNKEINYDQYGVGKTIFRNMIVDSHYIEGFKVPDNSASANNNSIITVYNTNDDLVSLMSGLGITVQPDKIISETTMFLYPAQIALLHQKAPYLIAMATEDISKLSFEDIVGEVVDVPTISIDSPNGEPVVGVIDTMFDESVYFSEWVEFKKMVGNEIPIGPADHIHGTAVSSIIVDGPAFNPGLDDGCGRFRVRHFGVAAQGQYSSFSIMRDIQEIVTANPDIKVWNLSLGSDNEVNPNFISPEAAILDKLQCENDVIFIVAGTNKRNGVTGERRIGSPADSINSIVVNAVTKDGLPASYSRTGLVLSFFNKPDVSSYGGDTGDLIRVCTPLGMGLRSGTSFAAPWVTRKVAYLIEVLGLSREVAKALLVDAAAGWDSTVDDINLAPLVGHGVVPRDVSEIVKSKADEIKFVVSGVSEKWDTYTYNLPIPAYNEKHPFVAKATLCYFPKCSINQGVDYTNTELDLYFGRVVNDGIKSINKNVQSVKDGERHYIYEGNARQYYRKWDNTKHIGEIYTQKVGARKAYGAGMWGISVKTKERLGKRSGEGIRFGLVVTLKEINGVNRVNDFVRQCELRGWLVSRVDVDSRVDIYNKAQETITFDV